MVRIMATTAERSHPRLRRMIEQAQGQLALRPPIRARRRARPRALSELKGAGVAGTKVFDAEAWQRTAYDRLIEVGELGYVTSVKANTVGRGKLALVERDPDTGLKINRADSEYQEGWTAASKVKAYFRGPQGGESELLSIGAMHDDVAGESHLFGAQSVDDNGLAVDDEYEFEWLSVIEVSEDAEGKVTRKPKRKAQAAPVTGKEIFTARYVRRAGAHSDDPTSAVQRALPILDQIVALDQMLNGVIHSRIPAGGLFIPNSIDWDEFEDLAEDGLAEDEGEDPDESEAGMTTIEQSLTTHMETPITDRGSAAALVSWVLRGDEKITKANIFSFDLAKPMDDWPMELLRRDLLRLATILDIPPETLSGKGGLSHWTGANVDIDFLVKHIGPTGDRLASWLSDAHLRKMMEEFEGIAPEVAARFEYEYDMSGMMGRDDEGRTAQLMYSMHAISGEKLREANGMDETWKPTPEEVAERVLLELMVTNPQLAWEMGLFEKFGIVGLNKPTAAPAPGGAGGGPGEAEGVPPGGAQEPQKAGVDGEQVEQIVRALADAGLRRHVERASNRLLSTMPRSADVRARLENVPISRVLSEVRSGEYESLGIDPLGLFDDEIDLGPAREALRHHFVLGGAQHVLADEIAVLRLGSLQKLLQDEAKRSLFGELRGGDDGLVVPAEFTAGIAEMQTSRPKAGV